ncbi:type IV pilus biogenesis/stability protein PilW [Vibrio fluminensis]|uniref:type IV pilus biogenesis/stability protein PilW n=1 Tax=Vibrio fluminensis TaxID=2783614 RepID=UPI0018870A07|nr:type IV pilus biogenesis/stability protein PilW [Vibrio fluminensis]
MKLRLVTMAVTIVGSTLLTGCASEPITKQTDSMPSHQQKADARIELAKGYLKQRNLSRAKENLDKAIQHAPNYYRTLLTQADYFKQVNELTKTERTYKTALYYHRDNSYVLNDYAVFLCSQQQYQRANEFFIRATEQPTYPHIGSSYANAGYCALKGGEDKLAIDHFRRSLSYQPDNLRTLFHLVELEIAHNDFEPARARLINAKQQLGEQAQILQSLVRLEIKAGNIAAAQNYQLKLAKINPHIGGFQ